MPLLSRHVGAMLGLLALTGAAAAGDCREGAMALLRARSPDGFAIARQVPDPTFFASWIDCGDAQFDLSTAVHESTHVVTGETDAFPLMGGGAIARPHEVSGFFPPARIAGRFAADDFTAIYLTRGKASSASDFLYLLDELNAYTHDLSTAVDLGDLVAPDQSVDHRDGLAAMMAFVAAYADEARTREPRTWNGLRAAPVATTLATLWTQAERVMASSCGIPNFGTADRAYLRRIWAAGPDSAIADLLGRAPACPAACLENVAAPAADQANVDQAGIEQAAEVIRTEREAPASRPRHPFAGTVGPRRHARRTDRD